MSDSNSSSTRKLLIDLISPLVAPLGYEIVHVEVIMQRHKALRIFIDHLEPAEGKGIGIEDCVKVTQSLDEPLDKLPELEAIFKGAYELEVSSPGVDRPLHGAKDFQRFSGRDVRIHVFRPLTPEELGNPKYHDRNPRQKNFLGKLVGLEGEKVQLSVTPEGSTESKKGKKPAKGSDSAGMAVTIPLPLIAKANLEPDFDEDLRD